jgi:hypothetical protein
MNDEPMGRLIVEEITPDRGRREGTVTFQFGLFEDVPDLRLHMPYFDADGYDEAVKRAASTLAEIAEVLAAEARKLAE